MNIPAELRILEEYNLELSDMFDSLSGLDVRASGKRDKEIDARLAQYQKQIATVRQGAPDESQVRWHEAQYHVFRAMRAANATTGFRKAAAHMAREGAGAGAIGFGMIAKAQEKGNATKALGILDESLRVFDNAPAHGLKAEILYSLGRKEEAKAELRHIINNLAHEEDVYVFARKQLDAWENPPKKGCGCGCLGGVITFALAGTTISGTLFLLLR